MLFHYGNCRSEIEKLNKERTVLLGEIQEAKALYNYQVADLEFKIAELSGALSNKACVIEDLELRLRHREGDIEELNRYSEEITTKEMVFLDKKDFAKRIDELTKELEIARQANNRHVDNDQYSHETMHAICLNRDENLKKEISNLQATIKLLKNPPKKELDPHKVITATTHAFDTETGKFVKVPNHGSREDYAFNPQKVDTAEDSPLVSASDLHKAGKIVPLSAIDKGLQRLKEQQKEKPNGHHLVKNKKKGK
jgi:TolA-binding protein